MGQVLIDRRGQVLELTISNPGYRNALSPEIYLAGRRAFEEAHEDPSVRAVLLHGADGFFCAGGNLNRLKGNRQLDPEVQRQSIDGLHAWILAMRRCAKPVVAAVEGAADDAKFVLSYARVGLSPDGGAIAALAAALPPQQAFAALALADPLNAQVLKQAGVVHAVCAPGQTLVDARALCERLASGPTAVYGRIKRLLAGAAGRRLPEHLALERDAFVESLFGDDAGEGIDAFLAKRPAQFRGT
jgi:enoyl-CoA hydratase/carnithine racemase